MSWLVLLIVMLAAAVAVLTLRNLLGALAAASVVSLGLSVLFVILRAPDVAMSEAAVGTGLSGVVMAMGLRRLGLWWVEATSSEVGANFVTAVVLGYRGIDTLGELAILFAAATAAGLVLGHRRSENRRWEADGGAILIYGADLFFPLLLVVGLYIILHGHLTPGGGFQGGVILAAAFFVPVLARPGAGLNHRALSIVEGLAGTAFIGIGLWGLWGGGEFLQPMLDKGTLG